jgi:hypothetical protein
MNTPLLLNRKVKAKHKIQGFAALLLCIILYKIYWQQYHTQVHIPEEMNFYIRINVPSAFFFATPNFVE